MGRNGKKLPVFPEMVKFVNDNVGNIVSSEAILLGKTPDRGSETSYLYKFIKAGYVESINKGSVQDKNTMYKILRAFPKRYNSCMLKDELRVINGYAPNFCNKE